MTEKEKKVLGKFKVWVRKWISDDGNKIIVELKASRNLINLVKRFALKDEDEDLIMLDDGIERYKIKRVLRSSAQWVTFFDYFFVPSFLKTGKIEFESSDLENYRNIMTKTSNLKGFISTMLELVDLTRSRISIEVSEDDEE